jgi:hypothetical protein
MISTCSRTAKWLAASLRPMLHRSGRPGCGRCYLSTTRTARRRARLRAVAGGRHGGVREELATGVGRVLINAQIAACTEFADCEEFRFQFTKLSGTIVTKLFSPLSSIRRTI